MQSAFPRYNIITLNTFLFLITLTTSLYNVIPFQVWDQPTVSTPPMATQDSFQDFLLELFLPDLLRQRTTTSRMILK